MALAIILIVLIAINIDKFTGGTVSSVSQRLTKVHVSSDPNVAIEGKMPVVMGGHNIEVTIETGSKGSKGSAKIYDSSDFSQLSKGTIPLKYIDKETGNVISNCGNTCTRDKVVSGRYTTSTDWRDGKHCVRVWDILESKYVEDCFCINECPSD